MGGWVGAGGRFRGESECGKGWVSAGREFRGSGVR